MDDSFSTENNLINSILDFPNAPLILQKVRTALDAVRKKREKFYEKISEQIKAAFINGEVIIHSPLIKIHNDVLSNTHRLIDAYAFEKNRFVGI